MAFNQGVFSGRKIIPDYAVAEFAEDSSGIIPQTNKPGFYTNMVSGQSVADSFLSILSVFSMAIALEVRLNRMGQISIIQQGGKGDAGLGLEFVDPPTLMKEAILRIVNRIAVVEPQNQ